tara:strand:+ start:162 stop:410 length:249 start_codon:yes stop_codon:yes gene_type:complete
MLSEINGEIKTCRIRLNVVWCPFCDRSIQFSDTWDLSAGVKCDGCDAVFKDVVVEETPPPRRRRSAAITQVEADAEEIADTE